MMRLISKCLLLAATLMAKVSNCVVPIIDYLADDVAATNHPRSTFLRGDIVLKSTYSHKMRMSILVGLEGSGHHYLIKAVNSMFNTNDEIEVNRTQCINISPFFTASYLNSNPSIYAEGIETATRAMRELAKRGKDLPWPGHVVRLCGEQSYPTGNGPRKVMHYIDLRLLAEMAENEGIDLRVIYLKRKIDNLLIADTVHRSFQNYLGLDINKGRISPEHLLMEYMVILLTDIAVVHSFLAELDPAFIVCHDYAHAGERNQVAKVAQFVAPNDELKKMYEASLLTSWTPRTTPKVDFPFPEATLMMARLQRKLDAYESIYCGHDDSDV